MKNRNFVNLNVNPCKMCMPMGAVTAFKGIEKSMMIIHGSQGCSTYIRRHMAGHYNEPVDIASSSLNEEGTVYGGEHNLKKALRNVIKLYNPGIIGVATTCLAETIGEDISRITAEFSEETALQGANGPLVIPVSTPGYGGTQFEGYFAALTAIVKNLAKDSRSNNKINLILSSMNPGDVRNIKSIMEAFEADYILLPDVSDTLDAPYSKEYRKIPDGGTKTSDIEKMAGAAATIEIGLTVPGNISPGQYLLENFNVPLYRCPLPIGISNTDWLIGTLSGITGKPVPEKFKQERGRLLDGMIDSHKHNGEGRAVIYGEPEQVLAVGRLCFENGIKPVLICTGTKNTALKQLLREMEPWGEPLVLDETDFDAIQYYSRKLNANILLGNSDGRVITEKEGIPLVRMGFPIHDRVGGQRLVFTGYDGSQRLLDQITNTLLENKYESYRSRMFDRYYKETEKSVDAEPVMQQTLEQKIEEQTKNHPCYNSGACGNARMHIPVAPACNISCNYCNRKYDCVNESRPGVTSEVLTPEEALEKFLRVKEKMDNLKVVGIAGPGDALANFQNTKKSIELILRADPDITFCLSTNGLMLPYYADEIINLGVRHVTITINAIDPDIGAKIYREVKFMGRKLTGREAAETLIKNQLKGLQYLASKGVVCKVNIVTVKGVNDGHIEEVVKKVKECGAYITNIMPLIPAKGSAFEDMPLVSNKEMTEIRKKCGAHIRQMLHCKQCRADAIGTLGQDCSSDFRRGACGGCKEKTEAGEEKSYTFAVASREGMLIDRHFGHVEDFYIYRSRGNEIEFVEKRQTGKYCSGVEDCDDKESRMEAVMKALRGCDAVLVLRIGHHPLKRLEEEGIKVVQTCGRIEEGIWHALEGMEKKKELVDAII